MSTEPESFDLDYEHGCPRPPAELLERVLIVASVLPLLVLAVVLYLCDLVRKDKRG